MSRTSIPARGELQYFLSLHATETRIGCCWIGILARVQIYLSMHSIRNKWRAEGLNRGNEVFFCLRFRPRKLQHRSVNVHSFNLIFHNYFDPVDLITEDAFRQ